MTDEVWRPLGFEGESATTYDALHDGVPDWMTESFWAWMRRQFIHQVRRGGYNGGYHSEFADSTVRDIERVCRVQVGYLSSLVNDAMDTTRKALTRAGAELRAADYLLSRGKATAPDTLGKLLEESGSAWKVGVRAGKPGLVRRVPEGVQSNADSVMAASGVAGVKLAQAWERAFGISPDPTGAYALAVRAVEDASIPVVVPGHSRNRVVHELGHSYGLHHSVNAAENGWTQILWVFDDQKKGWCGEVADDDAADYPDWTTMDGDTVAALGPVGDPQTEVWGVDPRYLASDDDLLLSAPQTNTSLMSYCAADDQVGQARWIGKRDYLQLLTDDHEPISDDPDAGTGDTIRGVIAADGQSAELKPALAVDFAPTADDPAGTHAVVLRDAAGGELWRTRFAPVTSHGEPATGGDVAASPSIFNVVVPRGLAGAVTIEVVSAGATLATGTVSDNAPEVSVPAPQAGTADRLTVTWSSSDADQDSLRHTVLYSADDGQTWNPIGMDLSGTSLSVARWSLPGSSAARIRVIASDGLRSTVATSPAFTLPNLAPRLTVDSPADGFRASGAQSIPLTATAVDAKDGSLDGSVVWSSDLDGQLGTGAALIQRADLLREGTHRITATVTDSGGATASETVTITVQRVAAPEPPSSDYVFGGFEPPVTPDGSVNAGRTIPVKWTVTGTNVSDTTVVSGAFIDAGATYDMVRNGDTWHVNAATPKEWAGSTRTFRVVLDDLSVHEFDLVFR